MKIVFLDANSIGDADVSAFAGLGEYISYPTTMPQEIIPRCQGAEIVITNKVRLMWPELDALPRLRLVCVAATGTNNIDLEHAKRKGIQVKNVTDYSTDSVAQLTLTMALNLVHHLPYYDQYVKSGAYGQSELFTHHGRPFFEIKGKKWGIIGLGRIGKRVAEMASTLGANVWYFSTSGKNRQNSLPHCNLDELLAESDLVSIHAPLNEQTHYLIDYPKICRMKPTACLINVGRGGIVHETGLIRALRENRLAGAALDVFEQEPLPADHPLLSSDIKNKLLLTPHIAWASIEARQRLVDRMVEHIRTSFSASLF